MTPTPRRGLLARLLDGLHARLSGARRAGRPTLGRDDGIGYFRDLSGSSAGPGVREEDEPRRWGRDR